MTSVLQAVKPTVNLLDAYGLRKDTGRWVIGMLLVQWINKLPMGHVCLAGKGHACLVGKM